MTSLSSGSGYGVVSVAMTDLALSIFLGLSLKLLWCLLQNLQLIVHLSLLNIILPPNVTAVFQGLISIASLNFIPKALIEQWLYTNLGMKPPASTP